MTTEPCDTCGWFGTLRHYTDGEITIRLCTSGPNHCYRSRRVYIGFRRANPDWRIGESVSPKSRRG